MGFESLEQRMAQSYIDLLPPFVPADQASVSTSDQEQFYNLINNLYQLALNEPLLFVSSLNDDDAYPNRFNKSSYGKPKLQVAMKKFSKSIDDLLQVMFLLGQGAEVKLNKRQLAILQKLGINDLADLPPAWVWMSSRPRSSLTAFSSCLFDEEYPYTSGIYARLLGEQAFRKLEDWMLSKGYIPYDIPDVTASDCKLSLTYANPAWSTEQPRGGFEYKIKHTGISARYDVSIAEPAVFGLCIPGGLKQFLEAFNTADDIVQKFLIEYTKRCDACKYCVQTDKTGTKPLAKIKVHYAGKSYNLCPYFPGTRFCWTSINDELCEQIIEMLTFMDSLVKHS